MSRIWFTADTHFHHKNLVTGVTTWEKGIDGNETRDFNTLEEHDEAIIQGINKYVAQDDTLWHLGDWSFGGIEQIYNFWKRLNCKKIHLLYGNHDHHILENRSLPNVPGFLTAEDLFLSVQHVHFGKIGQQTFFLSHFAHRVWNKSHHGVIHLYGHSHDGLDKGGIEWGKSMDVGMDAAFRIFGEYRPFEIGDILRIMDKRDVKIIDHHNSKTKE